METLRSLITNFTDALNFKTYRLGNESQSFDGRISGKIAKSSSRVNVQMKSATFKASDSISVLLLLRSFRIAYDSSASHEGAAMWLFQHFMKEHAKDALSHRVCAAEGNDLQ